VHEGTKDKTFQVGHRMQKNQNWQKEDKRKRKYYGSEPMAMDVLEKVCPSLEQQGAKLLKAHLATRDDLSDAKRSGIIRSDADSTGTSLQSYCDMLIEEYEEDLKEKMFADKKKGGWPNWLCVEETGTCTEDEYLTVWAEDEELEEEDEL